MRKFLIVALVAASSAAIGLGATAAHAEPSGACAGGPGGIIANPGAPGTSGGLTVCVTQGPVTGNLTAAGDATGPSGYAVADGDSTNPGASAGYIGVQGSPAGVAVVGCSNGDYTPGAGNVIASSGGQVQLPPPAGPTTPCSVAVP